MSIVSGRTGRVKLIKRSRSSCLSIWTTHYWRTTESRILELGSATGLNASTTHTCCRCPGTGRTTYLITRTEGHSMCYSASAPGDRRRACDRMAKSYSGHASLGASASRKPREGHVLSYVHQEEARDDIQRRYPADYRVKVDDKLRILTAMKKAWGEHGTTVFPCQEKFASERPAVLASIRPPDIPSRASPTYWSMTCPACSRANDRSRQRRR
jgi:hypothetical protein